MCHDIVRHDQVNVAYFLGNASTFRGPDAAALKKELKAAAGIK
jgi:hypothetical protein